MDYLAKLEAGDDLEAVCVIRGMTDSAQAVRSEEWMPAEWEEVAMDPDVLACHVGPQPTGTAAGVCETCGDAGAVRHPVIAGYQGDCPDCGDDDLPTM